MTPSLFLYCLQYFFPRQIETSNIQMLSNHRILYNFQCQSRLWDISVIAKRALFFISEPDIELYVMCISISRKREYCWWVVYWQNSWKGPLAGVKYIEWLKSIWRCTVYFIYQHDLKSKLTKHEKIHTDYLNPFSLAWCNNNTSQ